MKNEGSNGSARKIDYYRFFDEDSVLFGLNKNMVETRAADQKFSLMFDSIPYYTYRIPGNIQLFSTNNYNKLRSEAGDLFSSDNSGSLYLQVCSGEFSTESDYSFTMKEKTEKIALTGSQFLDIRGAYCFNDDSVFGT